ncbi:protein OSCP1-like [Corticium candelabrum]|uniref:protein OSCP1-like n=1 Tax=Corticium candelabrum TaxID=121492 RepID=UPI002E270550|nr:protein OSCP1-like [Corticium candelabrum]
MSHRALPILFLNLGGEMLYILDQRLRAQNIPDGKSRKVINDIIGMMMNKRFMEELFKPQETYPKRSMRTVFDRLAHASIMRLNSASMDKLYDLMTMAVKFQVFLCPSPSDILLITLNHIDALRELSQQDSVVLQNIDSVYHLLMQHYSKLATSEWQFIRLTLMRFFQDMHTKVSIFLKGKAQNENGWFVVKMNGPVPNGTDIPGRIRYFNEDGIEVRHNSFPLSPHCSYEPALPPGSLDIMGDRVTKLGTNMYLVSSTEPLLSPSKSKPLVQTEETKPAAVDTGSEVNATVGLKLLTQLLGLEKKPSGNVFRLNLIGDDDHDDSSGSSRPQQVIEINASQERSKELTKIMDDLSLPDAGPATEDKDKGDELLDLMDSCS